MEVGVRRVVFGAEIKTFGLEEREVREVISEVIRNDKEWEISELRMNGGTAEIEIEVDLKGLAHLSNIDGLKERAKDIAKLIESELANYARIKPFLSIYNNCNGNGRSEAKEIMSKLGIPVIS